MARTFLITLAIASAAAGAAAAQKPGEIFRDCPECPEVVVIPPGTFERGSPEDERVRDATPKAFADREILRAKVTIPRAFAMSRHEITRGEFARFAAATKRPDPPSCGVFDRATDGWGQQPGYSWRRPGFAQTDQHPAICMNWEDARDYAAWLAKSTGKPYRLASEAEWEYAARAGTTTARYWGDAFEPGCALANTMTAQTVQELGNPKSWQNKVVCTAQRSFTVPVGSFPANPFGLHDMIGNAFEWVQDCYWPTYEGAPTDGSARERPNCDLRIPRGGAFHSSPWLARAAFRGGPVVPGLRPVAAGIRVVRDLP
jgi:formylglycine-generating enzyme